MSEAADQNLLFEQTRGEDVAAAPRLRLEHLHVENYKAIDVLDLPIGLPELAGDPDVTVIGSRNGAGKTSVLESIALLLFGIQRAPHSVLPHRLRREADYPDLLIRGKAEHALLRGEFSIGTDRYPVELKISRKGSAFVGHDLRMEALRQQVPSLRHQRDEELEEKVLPVLLGCEEEPLLLPPLVYMHSFRKVREGRPVLGMLTQETPSDPRSRYSREGVFSSFKTKAIRAQMGKAGLIETANESEGEKTLDKLNDLLAEFAHVKLSKQLRISEDNGMDLRVTPSGDGPSFSFDVLSSGQKEIISTLFQIWTETRNTPSIVLIDEPELHLNAEWHWSFVNHLFKIAPQNQYILATHSEDVMAAVPAERRFLLKPG